MMNNFMNGMFGKIGSGMCKLSMSGNIAVKTSNGYKSYNVKSGKLTNCGNFVFPGVDENFFFVIPTNKVVKGDIILVNGKPKCVIEADKTKITVINYEDSTVETILPERHVFMGNTYFYVGQFDGIKDEVDYVIPNKGYSWSPLNMAHLIKRSMEWMKC